MDILGPEYSTINWCQIPLQLIQVFMLSLFLNNLSFVDNQDFVNILYKPVSYNIIQVRP